MPDLSYDAFELKNGKWYLKEDVIAVNGKTSEKIEVIDFDNPDLINLDNYELMVKESGLFFISRVGGIVYKIENSSLERIDKSLDNRLLSD